MDRIEVTREPQQATATAIALLVRALSDHRASAAP